MTWLGSCRAIGCSQGVPATLVQERLCLDHYLEQAFALLQAAFELCQQGKPVDRRVRDWLLADVDFAARSLRQNGHGHTPAQRDRLLELMLGLANLTEYLRHHSVEVKLAD
jgi:hypothetical protein